MSAKTPVTGKRTGYPKTTVTAAELVVIAERAAYLAKWLRDERLLGFSLCAENIARTLDYHARQASA